VVWVGFGSRAKIGEICAKAFYHKDICLDKLAQLSRYCGFSQETESSATAADKFIAALKALLQTCGFDKGYDLIEEKDYKKLINMILIP
jgi:alcohol dehydrogenase class IV